MANHYTAVYVPKGSSGPHILLSNKKKDWDDFHKIQKLIAKNVNGYLRKEITDRSEDICNVIRLRRKPTQQKIAKQIQKFYRKYFNDVKIVCVYFNKVPTRYLQ